MTLYDLARDMRKSPMRSEDRIWSWLRARRFCGYKFRRQYVIGSYVLDFYCAELKLAIEIDGKHHDTAWMAEHDTARTIALSKRGIEVVRISTALIVRDYSSAIDCISG